jgi:hypothetical protein
MGVKILHWDDSLACFAQGWADRCVFEHSHREVSRTSVIERELQLKDLCKRDMVRISQQAMATITVLLLESKIGTKKS